MKSRTSFFNLHVLRKNMLRFAPVWVLYTVGWVLLLALMFQDSDRTLHIAQDFSGTIKALPWLNLLYAGLCAALLFGDLFSPRMCNALHAMPIRREGWLLTHLASGILFALIPYGIAALFSLLFLDIFSVVAGVFFGVAMLQFLFFFCCGIFSAVSAGNRLGMAAVYFIVNFLMLLLAALVHLLYIPLLHGVKLDESILLAFLPVTQMPNLNFMDNWVPVWDGFAHMLIYDAVGIGILLLAIWIYRRRKLESAGDFIALKPLRPFFLGFYTLGMAATFYLLSQISGEGLELILLITGFIVGYFTGKMLLERTLKVFNPRSLLVFLLSAAVFAGSLVLTVLDPLGITRYVPDAQQVAWMRMYNSDDVIFYGTENTYQEHKVTEPADIMYLQQLHRQIIANPNTEEGTYYQINFEYELTNGMIIKRYYTVKVGTELSDHAEKYLSEPESVFHVNDFDVYAKTVNGITVDLFHDDFARDTQLDITDNQKIARFLEAVKEDCNAGHMAQEWNLHNDGDTDNIIGWLYITSGSKNNSRTTNIFFTEACTQILDVLEDLSEKHPDQTAQPE